MKSRCRSAEWINVTHTNENEVLVNECEAALASLALPPTSRPIFTVLVGGKRKSQILRQLTIKAVGASKDRHHQSICLWSDKGAAQDPHPTVYVDFQFCGADTGPPLQPSKGPAETPRRVQHKLDWRDFGSNTSEASCTLGNLLCSRVLGSFADSICYFISDFERGRRGIIDLLAEQAKCRESSSDIHHVALPTILIIFDTVSPAYDCQTAESKFISSLSEALHLQGESDPEACIRRHFRQISVVSLRRDSTVAVQTTLLREKLTRVKQEAVGRRAGFMFTKQHLKPLLRKVLAHFCSQPSVSFSFASATRPDGFAIRDFSYHLNEAIEILPGEKKWMSGLFCPIVNSAIMLASYPPGSHGR
jgi:hypothetical protein